MTYPSLVDLAFMAFWVLCVVVLAATVPIGYTFNLSAIDMFVNSYAVGLPMAYLLLQPYMQVKGWLDDF